MTKGFSKPHFLVPKKKAEDIKKVVACLGGCEEREENDFIPFEEAYPIFMAG
jgi:hypothetical protein